MSSTYTDKNNPFSRGENKHSQLETFSQPVFLKELFQIDFPTIVLPKDDRTDFAQEEQLGLPYFGQLCRGGRIQMSGHSDLGIFSVVALRRTCGVLRTRQHFTNQDWIEKSLHQVIGS